MALMAKLCEQARVRVMQRINETSLSGSIEEGRHVVNLLPQLHVVVAQLVQLVDQRRHLLRVRCVVIGV